MSIEIFTKESLDEFSFSCAEPTRLINNYRAVAENGGNPIIPNENYIPGVSISMSHSNWVELIETKFQLSEHEFLATPLQNALNLVRDAFHREDNSPYDIQRLIQLHNVIELGLSRRATKLEVQ